MWLSTNFGLAEEILDVLGVDPEHPVMWQLTNGAIWGSLALVAARALGWIRISASAATRTTAVLGAAAGTLHVVMFACAGLLMGFGRSPYSGRPAIVVANILYFVAILVAVELFRASIIAVLAKRSTTLALVAATLATVVLITPIARFANLEGWRSFGAFAGGDALPALSAGLLASFLALVGGPVPAIVYRGIVETAEWLSPILPDLTWQMTALVGTMAPMIGLRLIRQPIAGVAGVTTEASDRRGVIGLGTAVVALWFIAGVAGVQPVAISGPSMEPTLRVGDLVVIEDLDASEVAIGDIIRFRDEGQFIVHRVVDIRFDRGQMHFITRGDANNVDDDLVSAANLEGKVVLTIPKLGWPSIWLRQALD